jgi:hypothetical protein
LIQFGKAKHISKITLADVIRYPVWTSAHDDRHDEEWEKPVVSTTDVTQEILEDPLIAPIITLRTENSDLWISAWYAHDKQEIFAITAWHEDEWTALAYLKGLVPPLVLVSLPKILNESDVRFRCVDFPSESATRIV